MLAQLTVRGTCACFDCSVQNGAQTQGVPHTDRGILISDMEVARPHSGAFCTTSYPDLGLNWHPTPRTEGWCHFELVDCNSQPSISDGRRSPRQLRGGGKARAQDGPGLGHLLQHRPLAALALVPNTVVLFVAGAASGALGEYLCRQATLPAHTLTHSTLTHSLNY